MSGPMPFEMARMNSRPMSQAAFAGKANDPQLVRPVSGFRRVVHYATVLIAVFALVATIAVPLILAAR